MKYLFFLRSGYVASFSIIPGEELGSVMRRLKPVRVVRIE